MIGAAFFEQERKRTGGLIDLEFRPNDDLRFDVQYFMSDLEATNYNRNYLLWGSPTFFGKAPDDRATSSGTTRSSSAIFATDRCDVDVGRTQTRRLRLYGVYDQISRPDEKATSNYGSFEAEYQVHDALNLRPDRHLGGPRRDTDPGRGRDAPAANSGASWQLNGLGSAPNFSFGTANTSTPVPGGTPVVFGWIFGAQFVDVEDEENWAKIDADFADRPRRLDRPAVRRALQRAQSRVRSLQRRTRGRSDRSAMDPANYPTTFQNYPSDFNTFGGSFPTDFWFWSPSQLADYNGARDS